MLYYTQYSHGLSCITDLDYDHVDSSIGLSKYSYTEKFMHAWSRCKLHFSLPIVCMLVYIAENDLLGVQKAVIDLKANYYQLGVSLLLPPRELDAIRAAYSQNIDQALTEVLLVWLRHRYQVDKHGPPTWRRLVEAVDNPAGGNNHTLAMNIAAAHRSEGKFIVVLWV